MTEARFAYNFKTNHDGQNYSHCGILLVSVNDDVDNYCRPRKYKTDHDSLNWQFFLEV
jgi:hypothetical protein